jgi:hypothetical protein
VNWRAERRESVGRCVFLGIAYYLAAIGGLIYARGWRFELDMCNPVSTVGLYLAAAITPRVNMVWAIVVVYSIVYVIARVPRWSSVPLFAALIYVAATVARMWGEGGI